MNRRSKNRALSLALLCAFSALAAAQTLARPGWAGSGVAIEPWWRRAVFYRIEPANFQDSDGDGKGDLAGIAQRLGYLQSLGVDAIVLRLSSANASPEIQPGFDSLARAASEHKVRVMVELAVPDDNSSATEETYLNATRFWLTQGVAGIVLDSAIYSADSDEQAASFLRSLHTLLSGFPGGRILIADTPPVSDPLLAKALAQSAQLVTRKPLAAAASAAALRMEMEAALGAEPATVAPAAARAASQRRTRTNETGPATFLNFLWLAARAQPQPNTSAAQQLMLERTMAMLLLASRAAVLIDYGEEIGLGTDAVMQWTSKNITLPLPAPIERRAAATTTNEHPTPPKPKPRSDVYGPYVPYVPPAKPKPAEADVPAKIDPDTLPGFTTGGLIEPPPPDAATINVAVEEADTHSLLSLYRKLIQLHHGNASLHNGAETLLNHDELNALLWVRNPPPSATTAATVVAICNLSGKPLDLSLEEELKLRAGSFRTLAGDAKVIGGRISVAPGAVWLGEWRH